MNIEARVANLERSVRHLRLVICSMILLSFTLAFFIGAKRDNADFGEITAKSLSVLRPNGKVAGKFEGNEYGATLTLEGSDQKAGQRIYLDASGTEARLTLRTDNKWGFVAQSDASGGKLVIEDQAGNTLFESRRP